MRRIVRGTEGLQNIEKGGVMPRQEQFSATKMQFQLTEGEYHYLKKKLMKLRQEFVSKTGVNHAAISKQELEKIEQKMYSIEHKLAHSEIIHEELRIPDALDFIESIFIELRQTLSGLEKVLLQHFQKISHNIIHAIHPHSVHTEAAKRQPADTEV